MKHFTLLISFLIVYSGVSAQILKGNISKANGEPVPFATVYIHETTAGIVADEQGKFQTRLNVGTYTCEFRSLGYESQTKTIELKPEGTTLQITLAEKEIKLNELLVKPSKDNLANRVMRQAIAHAPQHLYQVSSFTSENYLKGSAKIEKVPGLMKMMIKDKKLLSLIGKLMVLESKNEVSYNSPNKYTQKVTAYKSSMPKEIEPKGGMKIATSSIYQADFMGYVSPLSTRAFQYYQFKLEDIFANGNYTVNKIKVIPRLQSDKLFAGYIYILEDNWSVFSVDFTNLEMGISTRYKISYQEVKPTVFMPITFDMYADIGTMGVKGFGRFYSSVKYNTIKVNPTVAALQNLQKQGSSVPTAQQKPNKSLAKIAALSAKEHLKTREAIQLARLMTAETKPQELKDKEKSLEIKDNEDLKMEIDSMSTKRDSTYWENVRNVPLRADEAESFKKKDTAAVSKNITTTVNSVSINLRGESKASLFSGGTIKLGKSADVRFDGLLKGVLQQYNFVDGAWLGQKVAFNINTSKTSSLNIVPSVYYTTARHTVVWDIKNVYRYAPLGNGQLWVNGGNTSEDIQTNRGTSRFFNSLSSLFFGDNAIRFYQKKYFMAENQVDITNGLRLWTGASYEDRQLLTNHTNYHFFGGAPLPNYPDQAYSDAFPNHTATTAWVRVEYTPYMKYRVKDGRKEYAGSPFPTFAVKYKKGISLLSQTEQSDYDKVDVSVHQNIKLSEFDRINYQVVAGAFLSKQKLYAPDLNYFGTNPLLVTEKAFDYTFSLLPNYSNSHSQWLETHFNYTSRYLLLKRIPFLQTKQFYESIHLHTLWNEQTQQPYSELGYSISFGFLGKVGIFGSFDGFKHKDTGIKISIPLFGQNWNR